MIRGLKFSWLSIAISLGIIICGVGLVLYYFLIVLPFKNRPYNVLMISVDTLRQDHMSMYGYPQKTTPHIDAWAKDNGVVFTQAYTQVPLTYPSFATTMTGLSPFTTSIHKNGKVVENKDGTFYVERTEGNSPISKESQTLASILKKQNYTTGAFIINSNLRAAASGLNKGFDEYHVVGDDYRVGGFMVEDVLSDGLAWLDDKKDSSQPFFLWMHFLDPHEPFAPREENKCLFAGNNCADLNGQNMASVMNLQKNFQGCRFDALPNKTVTLQEALYDAELYQTDSYVGQILDYIKTNKLDSNTIVIFYADHGEGFDHNYYFTHGQVLYESSVKIPFIISTPETRGKSKTVTQLVDNTQTLATTLSLLGLSKEIPAGQSGFEDTANKIVFYVNQTKTKFAVRKGSMKYIYTNLKQGSGCLSKQVSELYDLSTDPNENNNLAEKLPDVAKKLHDLLLQHVTNSKISFTGAEDAPVPPIQSSKTNNNQQQQQILKDLRDLGY